MEALGSSIRLGFRRHLNNRDLVVLDALDARYAAESVATRVRGTSRVCCRLAERSDINAMIGRRELILEVVEGFLCFPEPRHQGGLMWLPYTQLRH